LIELAVYRSALPDASIPRIAFLDERNKRFPNCSFQESLRSRHGTTMTVFKLHGTLSLLTATSRLRSTELAHQDRS
jgi:hypothetical protein